MASDGSQPWRLPGSRRERHERRVGTGLVQPVGVDVDAVGQLVVELDHAAGGVEDDPGLSLVGRDDQDRRPLHAVAQQPIEPHGGRQRALAVPGRDGDESLTRPRLVEHPATISRCQGRSFMRLRAPVPLGTTM